MKARSKEFRVREATERVTPDARHHKLPLTISREELLIDGSDRAFRQLVHDLFGFLARHEEIRAGHAATIGLVGIEYTVLIAVAHLSAEGDVNIKTVADHLHLSGAFITSVTRRLVNKKLIQKKIDPTDRRRVTLTVTAEGFKLLEDLAPIQRQVNDVEFSCLSKKEFNMLRNVIAKLINCGDQAVALQRYLRSTIK